MAVFGIDYAWGRPGPTAIKGIGAKFVCRYLSHDTGKNLTAAEARSLSAAGIWIVVVWETTAQRSLAGKAAGAADAREADRQAKACGMPAGRPVYFAVDWDATPGQQATINAYLDGAASVLGRSRVGIYGGYYPVKRALDAGKAHWAWQTYAWSGGHWDGRAHIRQYSNGHQLVGVGVDYNHAMKADYGQWRVGAVPTPQEDDLPTADQLWSDRPDNKDDRGNQWQMRTYLINANVVAHENAADLAKLQAAVAALAQKSGVDIDEDAIAAAIIKAMSVDTLAALIKDGLAADVVTELKNRL